MSDCKYCHEPLITGQPMYMGKAHISCHEKEYGKIVNLSFSELIAETKKLMREIERLRKEEGA